MSKNNFLLVDLNEKKTKKLAETITSDTSRKILNFLVEKEDSEANIAKELQIPIIAISQLSRQTEARTDKKPQLSDLRESGALEQDADMVIFLHRADAYKRMADERDGLAEVIIGKQRNGPTGTVSLAFLDTQGVPSFENLADEYTDESPQ